METPEHPPSHHHHHHHHHHRHGVFRKKLMFGIPCAVVGVLCIIGALVSGLYGKGVVNDRIHQQLVIDEDNPENSEYYNDWLSNTEEKDPPLWKKMTMWNLTNYEEVLERGATPVYEAVGPYVYREYRSKLNVTFSHDKKLVNYTVYIRHFFDSVQTSEDLDPYNDVIYNLNQIYIGILTRTGGEKALLQQLGAAVVGQIMGTLFGPSGAFNGAAIDAYLPYPLNTTAWGLVNEITPSVGSTDAAWNTFCSIWANSTTDPAEYPGFNSTMRLSVSGTPSGISLAACRALWSPQDSLGLLSTDNFAVTVWFGSELGTPDAIFLLSLSFDMTEDQVNSVLQWRARYKPTAYATIAQITGVPSVNYLGYAQWGQGDITAPVKDILVTLPFTVSPEFAIWANGTAFSGYTFTVDQTKRLFEGPYGMTNATNYFTFLQLYSLNNTAAIFNLWGLTYDQATALNSYYILLITNNYAQQQIQTAFAEGGGLVTWKTVDTWLWNPSDPLYSLVQPGTTPPPLAQNDTSEEWVIENKIPNTYHTGHDEINKINQIEYFEGEDTIDDVWVNPEVVSGTDGTQFGPHLSTSDTLEIWPIELLRSLNFKYQKTVTNYDITLYRFVMASKEFDEDPKYYQSVDGFANVTSVNNGNPIFLSMPNMYNVEPAIRNQVVGMDPDADKDQIQLDIEPLTGKSNCHMTVKTNLAAMEAHRRFQLNLYVTDSLLNLWNLNATSNIYFPLVAIDETSVLTAEQADQFIDKVYTPYLFFTVSFIVGLSVGGTLLVAGAIFTAWGGYQYHQRKQYTQIF